jgi:hydroxypyruvate reductase
MEPFAQDIAVMRRHAGQIFLAGLRAVEPGAAIRRCCRLDGDSLQIKDKIYDLSRFETILVLGVGKAGGPMAKAVEELLGARISEGLVTVKYGHVADLRKITLREAGHPVPDEKGMAAARDMLRLAERADDRTLVLFLVSGGGSALLPLPAEGLSLADKQATTRILLACGATIHEINALRKHLSAIKGGQLARAVFPATLVSLVLSDVVGDDLDTIASGPCVPDSRTFIDCLEIVEKYAIGDQLPALVLSHLRAGAAGRLPETPKPGDLVFERTFNAVIGSNFDALARAREMAISLGYKTLILSSMIEGEASVAAGLHMAIGREILKTGHPLKLPACLLSGGECTVTIRGTGLGGRNQEFALAAARQMEVPGRIVLLSAGTDGSDGPTDAAGAFVDSTTGQRAQTAGLDPQRSLAANDSYHFFEQLGDLYKTGPTNTNVMDLRIMLVAG